MTDADYESGVSTVLLYYESGVSTVLLYYESGVSTVLLYYKDPQFDSSKSPFIT